MGIYIHIPFCKSKCYYCDFYTFHNYKYKNDYISALKKELILRKDYLGNEKIQTIYFGGGTPSTMEIIEIKSVLKIIFDNFEVERNPEITLEANPDDLSFEYLEDLLKIGINRLSIGLQSFNNLYLKLMNRLHDAETAVNAVKNAKFVGFENISVDLIYGLPNSNKDFLKKEAETIISLNIQHISAYHLTIENKTVFNKYKKIGKIREISDTNSEKQFLFLSKFFNKNGFEHYEISNFAKKGFISKHNSSYWQNKKYLGIGVAAHSFNKVEREWNISNLKKYIKNVNLGNNFSEKEILNKTDKFNEFLLTGLRSQFGVDIELINNELGIKYKDYLISKVNKYLDKNIFSFDKNVLYLNQIQWFVSDKIILDLMSNEKF